jgi:multiple sugar transport system permease protein
MALWISAARMIPPIAFTIPFFLAYRYLHLFDTVTGLIIMHLTVNLPACGMDDDGVLRGSAAIFGGSSLDGWLQYLAGLPADHPAAFSAGLAATTVLCFMLSWNDFFFAFILTRTNAMTAPVAIVNFMQYAGWEWGKIAAASTLVMLQVVAVTFAVRTYQVCCFVAGGLKE